jgi:hypothetical protein
MAIYFPSLYCGINSILKLTKDLTIEYENGETVFYLKGEEYIVVDIIGYGFSIQRLSGGRVFRLMNSSIKEYFKVTKKVETDNPFDTSYYEGQQGKLVRLIKDFILKDVISIWRRSPDLLPFVICLENYLHRYCKKAHIGKPAKRSDSFLMD